MLLHLCPKRRSMPFNYDFTLLQNKEQLVRFLGLDVTEFDEVLAFDPSARNEREMEDGVYVLNVPPFLRHEIPKKSRHGGSRIVWEPLLASRHFKALARRLNIFFENKLDGFPHPRTFGYIRGRNIRENARDHCGHRRLLSIDLKDFFPSIKSPSVKACLQSTGVSTIVAELISRFVTIEGALPLGLHTSPIIANAICLPMDHELQALAQKYGATFSRYADDISFSGEGTLPPEENITACVKRYHFEIEESKTQRSVLGQAHYVTGLSVSDSLQPHVPRRKKRRLRQELYYAEKYGLDDHFCRLGLDDPRVIQEQVNRLDGLVKFTAYHEPRLSAQLKTSWAKILETSGHSPSFKPKNQHGLPFYIYIDEAEYTRPNGERLLALAMAASQHQDRVGQATKDTLDAAISDVWAAGNRSAIMKNGLHFSDATEDLRLSYVDRMRFMPFEGYVAMARLTNAAGYEATYLRLLKAIIKRRLMAAESQCALLVFEQNDKVRQSAIRQVVMNAYDALVQSNNRRPELCDVKFSEKPDLNMSVPDFLLGILGKYLGSGPEQDDRPLARNKLLFERIRDKYRLIFDLDSRTEYSRRRPIEPW